MAQHLSDESHVSTAHRPLPQKILVAVDGSEESLAAAQYAIDMARRLDAELSVLHVILIPEYVSKDVSDHLSKELASKGEAASTECVRPRKKKASFPARSFSPPRNPS